MAWTYSGDPGSSDRDRLRFLVGDVNATDPQLDDAVIEWQLGDSGYGIYTAAAALCRSLAARFARDVSSSVAGISESASQRYEQYRNLAKDYDAKATAASEGVDTTTTSGISDGAPYVGGLDCPPVGYGYGSFGRY